MKSLKEFLSEQKVERMEGEISPSELYEHFDVNGDGIVDYYDLAAKIAFHISRPEYIDGLLENLDMHQKMHKDGYVISEDSIQEFLESNKTILAENSREIHNHNLNFTAANPPNVLIMRRISVRQFPDGTYVGLYHIDALNKYVTVPFGSALSAVDAK